MPQSKAITHLPSFQAIQASTYRPPFSVVFVFWVDLLSSCSRQGDCCASFFFAKSFYLFVRAADESSRPLIGLSGEVLFPRLLSFGNPQMKEHPFSPSVASMLFFPIYLPVSGLTDFFFELHDRCFLLLLHFPPPAWPYILNPLRPTRPLHVFFFELPILPSSTMGIVRWSECAVPVSFFKYRRLRRFWSPLYSSFIWRKSALPTTASCPRGASPTGLGRLRHDALLKSLPSFSMFADPKRRNVHIRRGRLTLRVTSPRLRVYSVSFQRGLFFYVCHRFCSPPFSLFRFDSDALPFFFPVSARPNRQFELCFPSISVCLFTCRTLLQLALFPFPLKL